MLKLLLSLLAAASCLRAGFVPAHWQYRSALQIPAGAFVAQLPVNAGVYSRSRAQLRDLRVIRDGAETSYELQVSTANREEQNLPLQILNKAFIPGVGLEATLDLEGHPQHNRLRLATPQKNFKEIMRIETSDDARDWSLVRSEALLFDISRQDRTVSELTAEYPVSTRRYVRLTIPGWHDPALLESAWLLQVSETKAIRDPVASLAPAVAQDPNAHATSYTVDLGLSGQPFDQVQLSVGPDLFFRNVEIFTSNSGKDWVFAGASVLSNRPDDVHLEVDMPEQWSRYLKLVIGNGDSPPITIDRVHLLALRRTLRFTSTPAGHYWLYSGNAAASAPQYDLTQIVAYQGSAIPAILGPLETNPAYESPLQPWSDRNPHLLTGLVVVAAVLMAFVTVRLLLRIKAAQ